MQYIKIFKKLFVLLLTVQNIANKLHTIINRTKDWKLARFRPVYAVFTFRK